MAINTFAFREIFFGDTAGAGRKILFAGMDCSHFCQKGEIGRQKKFAGGGKYFAIFGLNVGKSGKLWDYGCQCLCRGGEGAVG